MSVLRRLLTSYRRSNQVKSEHYQWWGLRFIYFTAPLIMWLLAGEGAYLVACVAIRQFLQRVDAPVPHSYLTMASW